MGSASQIALIKPAGSPPEDISPHTILESVQEVPYFNGDHLLVAAALGGGNVLSLFVDTLRGWLRDLDPHLEVAINFQDVYEKMMTLAMEKLDTSLEVSPRFWAERHNPDMSGSVGNIRPDNISLGDVGSAMVMGVVENLYCMITPYLLDRHQVPTWNYEMIILCDAVVAPRPHP